MNVLNRLLPNATFWRFVVVGVVLAALTIGVARWASMWLGREMVWELQETAAYSLLRNAVDLTGRTVIRLEEQRVAAMDERRKTLRDMVLFMKATAETRPDTAADDIINDLNALTREFSRVTAGVLDEDHRFTVHSHSGMLGSPLFTAGDPSPLPELYAAALQTPHDEVAFSLFYRKEGYPGAHARPVLAAASYCRHLDGVVYAETDISELDSQLADKRRTALNELRARIGEIVIGRSGYIYIFDTSCNMVAHPSLVHEDFASLVNPGRDETLCSALRNAAEQPWGENKLFYDWDRPDDKGAYVYPKISWCTVEPTTGWVVGASMYVDELEAALPRFTNAIFLPALGSVILLAGGLALLLRNLLRPVKQLTQVCEQVSRGNLSVSAPEDVAGEIGFLCRQFNTMIKRIRGLRQKDERRRNELEDLNKNLERKVALRTRALERKAYKLEAANIRLREQDMLKTSFVSSVSHELRTPLTSIMGFAKVIRRDLRRKLIGRQELPEQSARMVERMDANLTIIADEGERLTRLVNDFLDIAKIESGRINWSDERVSPYDVATTSLDRLGVLNAGDGQTTVRLDMPPDLPQVLVDKDRITQVFINLVSNALKFTPSGVVSVSACSRDGWIQVLVRDTGCGVERRNLENIFDKFHQIRTDQDTLDGPVGTGLGLSISRSIIEHYGGLMWAESTLGRGTDVYFELPAAATSP